MLVWQWSSWVWVLMLVQSTLGAELTLRSEFVAGGFQNPLFLTAAPNDNTRLYVVEQPGRIRIIKNGTLLATPFLNIASKLTFGGERGLLGLAFRPDYAQSGYFYVNYTDLNGDTVVARYTRTANPDLANANSESIVLQFDQPRANHNGGMLAFGPYDGYLYIASGDGGEPVSPNPAEDIGSPLGKILRVDVSVVPYAIPPGNPFVGVEGADERVWSYGLRNPWRMSFDRDTGDLWIGDVGQSRREEIDFQPAASDGGENYGWRIAEGFLCYATGSGTCGTNPGFTPPILDYPRAVGQSITGGYVYRGSAIPALVGKYVYGDFNAARIWSLRYNGGVSEHVEHTLELNPPARNIRYISSFGEDNAGELYILDWLEGEVFRIAQASAVWVDFGHAGAQSGSFEQPFNRLALGAFAATAGDDVRIKGDSSVTTSSETLGISKSLRLLAVGGPVRIGVATKDAAANAAGSAPGARWAAPPHTRMPLNGGDILGRFRSLLGRAAATRNGGAAGSGEYQMVLPAAPPGAALAMLSAEDSIAVRFLDTLLPETIQVNIQPDASVGLEWHRHEQEAGGWLIIAPAEPWPGDAFTLQASGTSEAGTEFVSQEFEFVVQGPDGPAPGAAGDAYHLSPDMVFLEKTEFFLSLPDAPASFTLEYYCAGVSGTGWQKAEEVRGFLAEAPNLAFRDGRLGVALHAMHGGYVRLIAAP